MPFNGVMGELIFLYLSHKGLTKWWKPCVLHDVVKYILPTKLMNVSWKCGGVSWSSSYKEHIQICKKLENAINVFCKASRAIINWNKRVGFWVGKSEPPSWSTDLNFHWTPKASAVCYLRYQTGIELTLEQQMAPLLCTIKQKLLRWSSSKLSLARRTVMVNLVLLATAWYILSY